MKKFAICTTPRAGSKYISNLFNKIGIPTAHELFFNQWDNHYRQDVFDWDPYYIGVSGFNVVPHVNKLGPEYVVIIQKRNKQQTISSLKRIGILSHFDLFGKHYFHFINHHAKGNPQLKDIEDYEQRLEVFYNRWYGLAQARADYTYNLEELDIYKLLHILDLIKAPGKYCHSGLLQAALDTIPQNTNHQWPGKTYYDGYKH